MTDTTIPRQPWLGFAALVIALGMTAAVWFFTTPRGQQWHEEQLRPFGHAAILAYVLALALFGGSGFFVLVLAIAAAWRREPFRIGEVALAIFVAMYHQVGDGDPQQWSGFPVRVAAAVVLVLVAFWGVRRLLRLVAPRS